MSQIYTSKQDNLRLAIRRLQQERDQISTFNYLYFLSRILNLYFYKTYLLPTACSRRKVLCVQNKLNFASYRVTSNFAQKPYMLCFFIKKKSNV
jgi:hypothetical protein